MLRPRPVILINDKIEIDFCTDLNIESTWEKFTDTAIFRIPAKVLKGENTITIGESGLINVGDKIRIDYGYFPNRATRFTGFISAIIPGSPLTIECQDESWLLKQSAITKSFTSVTLKALLTEIVTQIPFEAIDAKLGQLRLTKVNPVQVLAELRKTYGLVSWVRGGVLFCGLAYIPEQATENTFTLAKNGGVADFGDIIRPLDLIYRKEEQTKIKVNAISMLPNNTKIEVQAGDSDGDTRTLFMYNVTDVNEVKKRAEEEVKRFRYEGFHGSFITFGEPIVKHGDRLTINDEKFPERDGQYLVDKVRIMGGTKGYRQIITLGPRVTFQEKTPPTEIISE